MNDFYRTKGKRLIRFKSLCERLDSPPGTVKSWITTGVLPKPHVRLGPRCVAWDADVIDEVIAS